MTSRFIITAGLSMAAVAVAAYAVLPAESRAIPENVALPVATSATTSVPSATTTTRPTTTTTTPKLTWCEQDQLWIAEFDELMANSAELSRSTAENLRGILEDAAVRSSYTNSWNRMDTAFVNFDHAISRELGAPAQRLEEAAAAKWLSAIQIGRSFEAIDQNDRWAFEDWLDMSVASSQDADTLFSAAIDAWNERCSE